MSNTPNPSPEERLFEICSYCHDGDYSVYEEKSCRCALYRQGESFFIRREFRERWDYKEISAYTEDIPVDPADLSMRLKPLSAKYCNGQKDNEWIAQYRIHRDADRDTGPTVLERINALTAE